MHWFHDVFGAQESPSFAKNRELFEYDEDARSLLSKSNRRSFHVGRFETPSYESLCSRWMEAAVSLSKDAEDGHGLSFDHIIGDAKSIHRDPTNAGAVFQVASQFNALEMVGPGVSPQRGITIYANDFTQGPACALSCPAATVFRNYFVNGTGQGEHQVDLLHDVGLLLNNAHNKYWNMQNGYCLPCNVHSMAAIRDRLDNDATLYDDCYRAMRVGVHWDTEVEMEQHQLVTQVFTSALPVAYSSTTKVVDWTRFACFVLEVAFDATLAVGRVLSHERGGARVKVYLTPVGGGAFGNQPLWIMQAIERALWKHRQAPLDVVLVHYRCLDPQFRNIQPIHLLSNSSSTVSRS